MRVRDPQGRVCRAAGARPRRFRADIVAIAPFLRDRVDELRDWDDLKLLTVTVDRLERWWRPGLLCIGDARTRCRRSAGSASTSRCRTRSPPPTSSPSSCATAHWPMPSRGGAAAPHSADPPDAGGAGRRCRNGSSTGSRLRRAARRRLAGAAVQPVPLLARIPARLIGMGFRPEHVRTPAVSTDGCEVIAARGVRPSGRRAVAMRIADPGVTIMSMSENGRCWLGCGCLSRAPSHPVRSGFANTAVAVIGLKTAVLTRTSPPRPGVGDQHDLARDDIDELVLAGVPIALARPAPGGSGTD